MPTQTEVTDTADFAAIAGKAITDLDAVVLAMLTTLPLSKPWQRQLVSLLEEASRNLQVLRLTISLNRSDAEITDAATKLLDHCVKLMPT